jgi:hypothetical protein
MTWGRSTSDSVASSQLTTSGLRAYVNRLNCQETDYISRISRGVAFRQAASHIIFSLIIIVRARHQSPGHVRDGQCDQSIGPPP